jgi:hypothetical protein
MRAGWLLICVVALVRPDSLAAQVAAIGPATQQIAGLDVAAAPIATAPTAKTDDGENKKKLSEKKLSESSKPPPKPVQAARPEESHSKSRLSEKPKPLLKEHVQLPERNPPIYEWNLPFLGPGNIISGFKSPTGAVWQPAFWVFGDFQTSAGAFNDGVNPGRQYAAARADIYGNLQLTPTERVVIGFTPLSQGGNLGTGVLHVDGQGTSFVNALNPNVQTLFFEGDTRQLFPGIDSNDRNGLDFGFAIGRQWISFQEGIMINDNIQALGITKDTIRIPGLTQDLRITGLYGWADIRRNDTFPDHSAYLLGVFTEMDLRKSIVTFDFAYVGSDNPTDPFGVQRGGSGVYFGASTTQRFGELNTAFRINTSTALDGTGTAVNNGVLLLAELSQTMPSSTNLIYANFFATAGDYTSAARSAQVGGPLERVGILFTPLAAGLAGSPIPGDANRAFGGALGYQMFFGLRSQLTLELAGKVGKEFVNQSVIALADQSMIPIGGQFLVGREPTSLVNQSVVALGGQYVYAITSRTSVQLNAFVLDQLNGNFGWGAAVGTRTRW